MKNNKSNKSPHNDAFLKYLFHYDAVNNETKEDNFPIDIFDAIKRYGETWGWNKEKVLGLQKRYKELLEITSQPYDDSLRKIRYTILIFILCPILLYFINNFYITCFLIIIVAWISIKFLFDAYQNLGQPILGENMLPKQILEKEMLKKYEERIVSSKDEKGKKLWKSIAQIDFFSKHPFYLKRTSMVNEMLQLHQYTQGAIDGRSFLKEKFMVIDEQILKLQINIDKLNRPNLPALKNSKEQLSKFLEEWQHLIFFQKELGLTLFGLKARLAEFQQDFKSKMELEVSIPNKFLLSEAEEADIFKIIQELTQNAIIHAQIKKAKVDLFFDERKMTLTYVSFQDVNLKTLEKINEKTSLRTIRNRIEKRAGQIDIQDKSNQLIFIINWRVNGK